MGFLIVGGSGGGGVTYTEVAVYADLPAPETVDGKIYIVKGTTGIWGFRKLAGFYKSVSGAWLYLGVGDWVDVGTDQTVGGVKTFTSSPVVPDAVSAGQAVNKGQLDAVGAAAATDATGKVTTHAGATTAHSAGQISAPATGTLAAGTVAEQLAAVESGKAASANTVLTGKVSINGTNATTNLNIVAENGLIGARIIGGATASIDLLYLKASASTQRLILEGSTGAVQTFLEAGGTVGLFGTNTDHDMHIRTNYQSRVYILKDGKVGIMRSPSWALDVATGWVNSVSGYKTNGADYGEMFESVDGQRIPYGTPVVLVGDKIRAAMPDENPCGVISATCAWIGNNGGSEWPRKYLRNEMGEELFDDVTETVEHERHKTAKVIKPQTEIVLQDGKYVQVFKQVETDESVFDEFDLYDESGEIICDEAGNPVKHRIPVMETYTETKIERKPVINPDYDETKEYILRENRPEWNVVGLIGQVRIIKGSPVAPSWIKLKDISETVELWLIK